MDVGVLPAIAIPVNTLNNNDNEEDEDHQIECNTIVGNSRGIITSYSSDGTFLWQIRSRVTWPSKIGLIETGFTPAIAIFPSKKDNMFIMSGYNTIGLFSKKGEELGIIDTDGYAPISPPIIGDFNNDGENDVILITRNSIDGYILKKESGSILFEVLIGILLFSMTVIWLTVAFDSENIFDNKGIKLKRATD